MEEDICLFCGSNEIVNDIQFGGSSAEAANIGPKYKGGGIFGFGIGIEPLLCDICSECGTIIRIYVNKKDRDWMKYGESSSSLFD